MITSKIQNAIIKWTSLGDADHGMVVTIDLEWGSSGKAFQMVCNTDKNFPKTLLEIMKVVGVSKWEDLRGKYVRFYCNDDSFNSFIRGIGHIVEDKWFDRDEWFSLQGENRK